MAVDEGQRLRCERYIYSGVDVWCLDRAVAAYRTRTAFITSPDHIIHKFELAELLWQLHV